MNRLLNLAEVEAAAAPLLEPAVRDYYAGGARDGITVQENRAAWSNLRLRPRCLRGIPSSLLATTVLGAPVAMPLVVPPMAFQRLAHPDGELALVRAAGEAGLIYTLSTLATTAMEEVCAASTMPVWFQLYLYRDRGATRALVDRARAAGCAALVLTVDAPIMGTREADVRNRFSLPAGLRCENLVAAGFDALPVDPLGSGLARYVQSLLEPALSWRDVDWLVAHSGLPVILKGIMRGDDARRGLDHGARALIVSNHGGRQLDTAAATADLLPDVIAAVDGAVEVLVDGGLRRGTDLLKALALGARAGLVGRPLLWGLAVGGQAGAAHVLGLLRAELAEAMLLAGCGDPSEVSADLLATRRPAM